MRFLHRLLLLSTIILVAGCSAYKDASPLAPTSEATHSSDRPRTPVQTRLAAAATGVQLFEAQDGFTWLESPQGVLAEEMSYADANRQIGLNTAEYDRWPEETRVWFVVLKGRWQLIPLDPAQANPPPVTYEGCLLILFTAEDASLISAGDAVCPTY